MSLCFTADSKDEASTMFFDIKSGKGHCRSGAQLRYVTPAKISGFRRCSMIRRGYLHEGTGTISQKCFRYPPIIRSIAVSFQITAGLDSAKYLRKSVKHM